MSTGLMSCVRENSPPLEQDMNTTSGPLSLPEISTVNMSMAVTSTPVINNTTTSSDGGNSTAGTGTAPNAETQKRRRFHPLRNLRRIFRRRTITTPTEAPTTSTVPQQPTSSNSEKNLRSATLSSISSVVSASSPSSPLSHQQIQDAYSSQSLPKSKTFSITAGKGASLLGGDAPSTTKSKTKQQQQQQPQQKQKQLRDQTSSGTATHDNDMYTTTTTSTSAYHHSHHTQNYARHTYVVPGSVPQRQSLGVAVLPSAMNRSFFNERQKLRSVGDSSQDLDSSGNGSGNNIDSNIIGHASGNNSNGEMSDSQRSLSEGRLVDSDYTHDQLSQSHDSVFSESATASSLSSVLKAELADVLRKRRNRPDASDEDLGLPRSPASPQRRAEHQRKTCANGHNTTTSTTTGNQSEVSSLSLLSMNSTDGEEFFSATSANNSNASAQCIIRPKRADLLRRSTSENFSNANDEVDLFDSNWQRLSHSAAKHKMAIRPAKKKGPSRQHRRTLETSIPEAIEETPKTLIKRNLDVVDDAKAKTRSLPPSSNTKLMDLHADDRKYTATTISAATAPAAAMETNGNLTKSTKTEKVHELNTNTQPSTANSNMFGLRALTAKASSMFDTKETAANATASSVGNLKNQEVESTTATTLETAESGFLRRLMQRNSKRTISKTNTTDEELEFNESMPKKMQISTSAIDTTMRPNMANSSALKKSRSAMGYSQNVEETRKEIKREIMCEGANGINAMLSSYVGSTNAGGVSPKETPVNQQQKPKSGPAARQRYLPQDIAGENTLERKATAPETAAVNSPDTNTTTASLAAKNALSKPASTELFQSTSIIREIRAAQLYSNISSPKADQHYEKKPKFVGLSAFQQKISRSNDAVARSSNSSLEAVTGEINYRDFEQKQRKLVEKSRSFRSYNENRDTVATTTANMPSLPDLSLNLNLSVPTYNEFIMKEKSYHATPSPPDQSVSLGFEINDNNLVKPNTIRAGSANNVSHSHTRNITPTTTRLLTPATVLPQLSPTNSCNRNINEIEQNIDLIVKSPFISVLRNSVTYSDEALAEIAKAEPVPTTMDQAQTKTSAAQKSRPKVLELKESTAREEDKMTPTTAAVPLREKAKVSSSAAAGSAAIDHTITKETLERKSAPAATTAKVISNAKVMKRNTSLTETVMDEVRTDVPEFMKIQLNRVDPARMAKTNVVLAKNIKESSPSKDAAVRTAASIEDLSIRRLSNESVDINEKQFNSPTTDSPIREAVNEAVNRQARIRISSPPDSSNGIVKKSNIVSNTNSTSVSNGSNVSPNTVNSNVGNSGNNAASTNAVHTNNNNANKPRNSITSSPMTNGNNTLNRNGYATTLYSSTEPNRNSSANVSRTTNANNNIQSNNMTYVNGNSDLPPKSPVKKMATTPLSAATSPTEESVVLRPQTCGEVSTSQTLADVKLSLQHRKRLFMQDEQAQTVRKIEEIRNERKKSINDEVVFRKSITKSEEKLDTLGSPTKTEPNPEHLVTLRKKSFGAANASGIPISNNNNTSGKEDATPELMKVFARRSLKIKDEDLAALTDKIMNTNGNAVATTRISNNAAAAAATNSNSTGNTLKKLQQQSSQTAAQQQNVDSDKENQSASEEKLDKLTKTEVALEQTQNNSKAPTTTITNVSNSNRNSLADFRNGVQHKNGLTVQQHNNNNNSSNNNNNHNNNTNTMTNATTTNKSGLPVARSFRAMSSNLSSVSNNNNGLSAATKSTLERKSLNYIKPTETQNVSTYAAVGSSKTIERSATVSEFKGIHQRRAEWEQRAKEAFK